VLGGLFARPCGLDDARFDAVFPAFGLATSVSPDPGGASLRGLRCVKPPAVAARIMDRGATAPGRTVPTTSTQERRP
jgi:hypothetical protein